jgi:hypothetical protein
MNYDADSSFSVPEPETQGEQQDKERIQIRADNVDPSSK